MNIFSYFFDILGDLWLLSWSRCRKQYRFHFRMMKFVILWLIYLNTPSAKGVKWNIYVAILQEVYFCRWPRGEGQMAEAQSELNSFLKQARARSQQVDNTPEIICRAKTLVLGQCGWPDCVWDKFWRVGCESELICLTFGSNTLESDAISHLDFLFVFHCFTTICQSARDTEEETPHQPSEGWLIVAESLNT